MKYVVNALLLIFIAFGLDYLLENNPALVAKACISLIFIALFVHFIMEWMHNAPVIEDDDESEIKFPKHWTADRKAAWKAANGNRVLPPNSQRAEL